MTTSIVISGLSKTFVSPRSGEKVTALDDVSLDIEQGEFVSVVGPSGCGKSTMLSIVAGILPSTAGEVSHYGEPIVGPHPDRGVLFQDYALFPWLSVSENIEFGPRSLGQPLTERRETVANLVSMVGLEGFESRLPHELSGGMRQRCALARMLANQPKTWLMDEPLAAVDLQTRTLLQEELLRIWGEDRSAAVRPNVMFVTHGIDEAVLMSDRIIVLGRRPGRVKASVPIDLPRPRFANRNPAREGDHINEIWNLIRDEAAEAIREE